MERDFYRDEFEQFLKENTDDFKMYPSRKVWHSIYNDRHPDRKWPSLAVCLLLLSAILYVGVSNNNSINTASRNNITLAKQNEGSVESTKAASKVNHPTESGLSPAAASASIASIVTSSTGPSLSPISAQADIIPVNSGNAVANMDEKSIGSRDVSSSFVSSIDGRLAISVIPAQPVTEDIDDKYENSSSNKKTFPTIAATSPEKNEIKGNSIPEIATIDKETENKERVKFKDLSQVKINDNHEKEWMEDYAFHNQPKKPKKLFAGLDGEFYITPGVGYRVMFQNSEFKKINNALVAANSTARYAEPTPLELNQQIGLTMEMGGLISKNIGKKLRVKTGLQLNITDYITYAKRLDHPGQTTVALTDINNNVLNFEPYSTNYANVPGENSSQLHNKTIQVSVPIGADYKLVSAGKLAWHVGGSIQPSYLAGGYAYLVSSDNNYFVEDQSMLRRWNLNGALESFVSIKTRQGMRINLGPQFRYSLFSVYNKSYSYTEKPYSLGFKIGFSKAF
jgi:hypothetical protein